MSGGAIKIEKPKGWAFTDIDLGSGLAKIAIGDDEKNWSDVKKAAYVLVQLTGTTWGTGTTNATSTLN